MVLTEYVKPRECLKDYDKYSVLVSGQAERDVNKFLSQPYSFQEILAEVIRYQNLAEQIQYSSDEVTCLNIDSCHKVCLNHAKDCKCQRFLYILFPVTCVQLLFPMMECKSFDSYFTRDVFNYTLF